MVDGPSNIPVPTRFRPSISRVVARLAAGDCEGLRRDGTQAHPDADLSMWIRDYGRDGATLIPLPEEAWGFAEAFELDDEPGTWHVVIDLWTKEEGRSDLSMEALVIDDEADPLVRVNDIHVM